MRCGLKAFIFLMTPTPTKDSRALSLRSPSSSATHSAARTMMTPRRRPCPRGAVGANHGGLGMIQLVVIAQFLLISMSQYASAFVTPRPAQWTTAASVKSSTTMRAKRGQADREEELNRLADTLKVGHDKVKDLLKKQRSKMKGTEEKAKHIDWLLDVGSNIRPKTQRKSPLKTRDEVERSSPTITTRATTTTMATSPSLSSNTEPQATRRMRARPRRPSTVTQQVEQRRAEAEKRQEEALKDPTLLTNVEFAKRKDLHPSSKRALTEVMGLKTMTEIQSKTYVAALSGRDVLGRARTGTGKTVAFLLPAIERVLRSREYQPGLNIGILVISPTRELAQQIGDEAEKLLTFHTDMSVQVVFGGTKVSRDAARLRKKLPTILVATPGRLQDLLESTKVGARKFSDIMSTTSVCVLDETDQLLDMGFRREIKKILTFLPRNNKRQTLLFSATIPKVLKQIMAETMKDDYIEVDCINDGDGADGPMATNIRVKQSHAIIPSMDLYVSSVVRIVLEAIQDGDGNNKIVVFFPTARMVSFFADIFNEIMEIPALELHSKKTQGYRNRVSGQFREASSGLLFTSDVSARGVDYPKVSHVIQFGMPSSREQYIHRLGRTGRAGTEGKGWLILGPFESLFLEELKGIEIPRDPTLNDILKNPCSGGEVNIEKTIQEMEARVGNGDKVLSHSGQGAYQAFLGYYLGQMKRIKMKRKEVLVNIANEFSGAMGFREVPALGKNMINKMGLKGISGISVKAPSSSDNEDEYQSKNISSQKRDHSDGRRMKKTKRKSRAK